MAENLPDHRRLGDEGDDQRESLWDDQRESLWDDQRKSLWDDQRKSLWDDPHLMSQAEPETVSRDAAVFPSGHGLRVFRCQQSAPLDRSQQSPAHGGLDFADRGRIQSASRVEAHASLRSSIENTIDDDAVIVEMGVEQRAKTVDEDHSAEAGRCTGTRAALLFSIES